MAHAWRHKEADGRLRSRKAAKFGDDAIEIVDAVERRDEVVGPAVIEDEFAAMRGELSEVGIDGFKNVVAVEFGGEAHVLSGIERAEVPSGIFVNDETEVIIRDGEWFGAGKGDPSQFAARLEAGINLLVRARIFEGTVDTFRSGDLCHS